MDGDEYSTDDAYKRKRIKGGYEEDEIFSRSGKTLRRPIKVLKGSEEKI